MSTSENVFETSDAKFDADVKESQVSLVDFWAAWCGPCRMLAPTIDSIAKDYTGKAKVFKMNVDENPDTPTRFHIRGIPTVIVFKDGQAVETLVGNQPKDAIAKAIDRALS